jgi:nucleoside-diphosphate-sugar epimerase
MLAAFARQTGLSAAWGRIFFLYGPHEPQEKLVSSVTRALLKGAPVDCTDGRQLRDFLYVKDVAAAFVTLLESQIAGPINIASGRPLAIKEIILKIAEKMNRADLVRLGTLGRPPDDPPLLVADTTRLKNELGWSPQYDLDKGVDDTIRWWQEQLHRPGNE